MHNLWDVLYTILWSVSSYKIVTIFTKFEIQVIPDLLWYIISLDYCENGKIVLSRKMFNIILPYWYDQDEVTDKFFTHKLNLFNEISPWLLFHIWQSYMKTSWLWSAFSITSPLWGESTSHWWIPLTKSQWCGALIFPLMSALTNCWANSREAGELKCLVDHLTSP